MNQYPVEILNFGAPNFDAHQSVIRDINALQKDVYFTLPPERCKDWAVARGRREWYIHDVWEQIIRYKAECRGFHPFIIGLVHGSLRSDRWENLFGSHEAAEGLAVVTTKDWEELFAPPPLPALLAYYFVRYAISFVCPEIKNHDDARNCYFDRKSDKRDILPVMRSGQLCDPCQEILGSTIAPETYRSLLKLIEHVRDRAAGVVAVRKPKLFIVHGRDEQTKWAVKNYLQNRLQLPEPVVLHEQANHGRTIIEKFEEHAADVDGAVVLLTPDDRYIAEGSGDELRRARQNVIFEMGYLLRQFGRESGKVLLLYKKPLDLPSDISGVVYIDITNGVEAAGEQIRREIGL